MFKMNSIILFFIFLVVSFPVFAKEADVISGLNLEDFGKDNKDRYMWENNPFIQVIDEVSLTDMSLTAIVFRQDDAAALINGEVVREGGKVGFSEIIHIAKDRVVLKNENGIFNLVLKKKSE